MDGYKTWSNSLESILEDASALEAFKEWFKDDKTRLIDSIDLYFAIKAFKNLIERNDPKCAEIACKIHRRYISIRSGTCTFLPDAIRKEMSERIHALSANKLPHGNLFESCQEELLAYLRKQHALFVHSDHFYNLLNQNAEIIEPTTVFDENDPIVSSTGCHACASTSDDISIRFGGRNSIWKKSKPPRRNFGVQNVSKRDSRDSISCSAVSSEDSGNKRSSSKRHSERLPLQRIYGHQQQQALLINPPDGSDFKHQRPEERERFSEILRNKLDKIAYRLEQYKHETGIEIFARDLDQLAITTTEGNDEVDSVISNDSLDKYEQRMNAECDMNPAKEEKRRSMSTSPIRFTNTLHVDHMSNPYGRHGFAPPPGGVTYKNYRNCATNHELHSLRSTTPLSSNDYGGHRYSDSSGFCSSESANIINRAALFEKARHMAMSTQTTTSFPQSCSEVSTSSFYYYSFPFEQQEKRSLFVNNLYPKKQQLVISYKEENAEAPFVAKLEMRDITFREFRRCFGISSKTTKRFFFKSDCEDRSAPYQWTIIDDDFAVLPIFEGRITAECRSCSESD
ncbi:regulator of G protein signaling domain protein [Onchocerca flexuosa]|uniref:Regulator of G protein signaling domain protein n=1 Tax=Onchocerca flexuosa TaxID=387005 RepID=A0A238BJ12_9BILA|nr:regulator of G protein signaling domain protein [Onchocerca flexuosa]